MAYENNDKKIESVYSNRVKAGKRRTYFFDVRETRGSDYFLTITESRKRFDSDGYDRHKIFLYKEDFNKFIAGLTEAVNHVKTELMPDFDFDSFSHDGNWEEENNNTNNNTSNEQTEHGSGLANALQNGNDAMPPPKVEPVLGDDPHIAPATKSPEAEEQTDSTDNADLDHRNIEGEKW